LFLTGLPFYILMEKVQELLIEFSAKTKELKTLGGPEKNGPLFEELLGLREKIFEHFGLPQLKKYCQSLWDFTDKEINDVTLPGIVGFFKKLAIKHQSPNEDIGYVEIDDELALEAIKKVIKGNN